MKTCCRCHQPKPTEAFSKDKSRPDGLQPRCKECQIELRTKWGAANREMISASGAFYRALHPDAHKNCEAANLPYVRAKQTERRKAHVEEERERHRIYHFYSSRTNYCEIG